MEPPPIAARRRQPAATAVHAERAMLAGIAVKGTRSTWPLADSLRELAQLAVTGGAQVVGTVTQNVERRAPTYLGKGKLDELATLRETVPFDTLVCDDELSPNQQRSLEDAFKGAVKVIDRTALILDVFARHASTREGRLQVELAQAEYLLPRLAGQWSHLERLGGGIGTRGPGESQLETDRRLAEGRIVVLKRELEQVRRQRAQHRRYRQRTGVPVVSLVGYTNAGKSSLLNALAGSDVITRDQPFSTLDPVTRRVRLPGGTTVLLTDTVGFIQKLPTTLVAAFRATLEELDSADLLLHVVDIAHPNAPEQVDVVDGILKELALEATPRILVLNKTDLLDPRAAADPGAIVSTAVSAARQAREAAVVTSTRTGRGLPELRAVIEATLATRPHPAGSPGRAAERVGQHT